MARLFIDNVYRIAIAAILAFVCCIFGGCVITQLRLGLATDPLGPYVAIDYSNPTGAGTTLQVGGGVSGGVTGTGSTPTTNPTAFAITPAPVVPESRPAK